jgi:DNA transposition AAA+ family ATPase
MPGFAKASSKWSSTPATSHTYDVPLPQLLQDMGYQGASTNKHTQSLVRLFSRHEMAMQVTKAANADIPKEFVIRRQRQPDVPPKQRPKARNRLIMEREEMAMTRKLLMKGQSLTL